MKVTRGNDELQRFSLTYEVGEYDAHPCAPALVVERALSHLVSFRAGVAEALTYLSSSSGPLETADPLAPASVEILQRIQSYSPCMATNVTWKYSDIQQGSICVGVDEAAPGSISAWYSSAAPVHFMLHLLDTSRLTGSMNALREGWVSTNAVITASSPAAALDRFHRRLAVLLLLSGDLDASGFVIPSEWINEIEDWESYQMLFKTVGLNLTSTTTVGGADHA